MDLDGSELKVIKQGDLMVTMEGPTTDLDNEPHKHVKLLYDYCYYSVEPDEESDQKILKKLLKKYQLEGYDEEDFGMHYELGYRLHFKFPEQFEPYVSSKINFEVLFSGNPEVVHMNNDSGQNDMKWIYFSTREAAEKAMETLLPLLNHCNVKISRHKYGEPLD